MQPSSSSYPGLELFFVHDFAGGSVAMHTGHRHSPPIPVSESLCAEAPARSTERLLAKTAEVRRRNLYLAISKGELQSIRKPHPDVSLVYGLNGNMLVSNASDDEIWYR